MDKRAEHTQFDYLLNAFEATSQSERSADNGYDAKRKALYAYVRELERTSTQVVAAQNDAAALRELLNVYNLGGWTDAERLMKERNEVRAQVVALQAEVDALREEAMRYQWIREHYASMMCSHIGTQPDISFMSILQHTDFSPEMLDAAIDAERKAIRKQKGA